MIDDAKIRCALLERFPQIEPFRLEMEEYEFGDAYGAHYRSPVGVLRARAEAKDRSEDDIAADLIGQMSRWFEDRPVKRGPGRPRKAA